MTLTRSFIRNAVTTPLDARIMNMGGVVCNADGSPRVGVLGDANIAIVTALATMNVAIAAAEFVTSKGRADGIALFGNDGTVNVAITAAPVSNSRIDVIWVKHNDDTTGDANALPVFGVTAGTAAAIPTKPAIPTGALELATLRVYSGTTAANGGSNTLVNTYQMTAARGGVVPFRTKADLDLWTTATLGQTAYAIDTDTIYERAAAGWAPVFKPWATYTPTLTNFTMGAAVVTAKWMQIGNLVKVVVRITLGAGSNITGNLGITFPVASVDSSTRHCGSGSWIRAAVPGTPYPLHARLTAGTTATPALFGSSSAIVTTNNLSNNYPGAPASGDSLYLEFDYEV